MSHDIDDIIAVMDGRSELIEEVSQSESALVNVLIKRFNNLLKDQSFVDAVSGHMPTDEVSQSLVERILDTIKEISDIECN